MHALNFDCTNEPSNGSSLMLITMLSCGDRTMTNTSAVDTDTINDSGFSSTLLSSKIVIAVH